MEYIKAIFKDVVSITTAYVKAIKDAIDNTISNTTECTFNMIIVVVGSFTIATMIVINIQQYTDGASEDIMYIKPIYIHDSRGNCYATTSELGNNLTVIPCANAPSEIDQSRFTIEYIRDTRGNCYATTSRLGNNLTIIPCDATGLI